MKRRIVSDSSANMLAWKGMDFDSVPLKIIAGEREYVDDARLDLTGMLDYLSDYKGKSGTSCPNVADWLDAFQGADEIFALTITSSLSGSYAMAVQAQEEYKELHPEAKVMVLDTLSTGPEMVLIMEKIQELTEAGQSFEETEAAVREYSHHTHLFFCSGIHEKPGEQWPGQSYGGGFGGPFEYSCAGRGQRGGNPSNAPQWPGLEANLPRDYRGAGKIRLHRRKASHCTLPEPVGGGGAGGADYQALWKM